MSTVAGQGPRDDSHRRRAEHAARSRLVLGALRELDVPVTGDDGRRHLALPGATLSVAVRSWSPSGHHDLGPDVLLDGAPADHDAVVAALLDAVGARVPTADLGALRGQVADSVARTARYLAAPPYDAGNTDADTDAGRTRAAEQGLRLGHPFHPTPKSAEGLGDDDLVAWAPELGASFVLHHLALAPSLVVGDGDPAPVPAAVAEHLPAGWVALPMHPFQARRLADDAKLGALAAQGTLRWLGPLGDPVWPTSSVRTVVDTVSGASWKLPLHARLTHFVRTNPPEQARRAVDASRVVAGLGALPAGFAVIPDRAWRTVDPEVVGEPLAAELTVVDRAPFPPGGPRVLAAVLEEGPCGEEPPLVADVRLSGGDARAWVRRWLAVSLVPLLRLFATAGIGFEAHPQNTLVVTERGWPVRCVVRDMEGAHVRADRRPPVLPAGSPLVYTPDEAWQRLRYHAVVNQLALLVAVLGRHTVGEAALWRTVADVLGEVAARDPETAPWARDLRTTPTLPAKAHLLSRAGGRGEDPLYVAIPNPIAAAAAGGLDGDGTMGP